MMVGRVHALATTQYGQLVMAKIAQFVAMLALAAMNNLWWARESLPATRRQPRRPVCSGAMWPWS